MSEFVALLLRVNLAAGLAILAVAAARPWARRWLGAEDAYGLWAIPLGVAAASLLPARGASGAIAEPAALIAEGLAAKLIVAWLAGAVLMALWVAVRQWRFLWLAGQGRAGPAAVGLIAPRLVMPPDDGAYSPAERAAMRAHELEHIRRGDLAANALLAGAQCVAWFNPLVHVGAWLMRFDQELACDAAVIRRGGIGRAAYARALVKVQVGPSAPLAAGWSHPLERRIAELSRPLQPTSMAGPMALTLAGLAAAAAAWMSQPPAAYPDRPDFPAPPEGPSMSVMLIRVPPGDRFPS
jgi:beta-lactamase regulating signal transducer with metallopeptidase domain